MKNANALFLLTITNINRNSPSYAFMEIKPRRTLYMRGSLLPFFLTHAHNSSSNCEPLTPDDIAESIVFVAGQRENVVIAVSLTCRLFIAIEADLCCRIH